jgi:O-antigen ligase
LGYFDPTNATGPFTDIQSLRIVDFNGGFPVALGLLFFAPLLISLSVQSTPRRTLLGVLALGWIFYGSLFIQSRTYPMVILFGVGLCFLLWDGVRRKAALLTLGVFILVLIFSPEGANNLTRIFKTFSFSTACSSKHATHPPTPKNPYENHDSRWPMWDAAMMSIHQHPWVGLGPGQTRDYPFGERTVESDGVDNLYLTLALKWGLGFLLFLAAWLAFAAREWRRLVVPSEEASSFEQLCAGALGPALGSFSALCILSYPLTNISATMFLAAFLGLSVQSRFNRNPA